MLINAGTNNAIQSRDLPVIRQQMDHLLDGLYEKIPGTTVLLSTLLQNINTTNAQNNTDSINEQYRDIVTTRSGDNQRIVLAEMAGALPWSQMNVDDHTHPTDEGYVTMSQVWWKAFQEAESRQFLQRPKFSVNDTVCP